MRQQDLVGALASEIERARPGGRALVAVDGPDAAGKTTLVAHLAAAVDRPVVTASVDDWLRPRAQRLQRGALSPEGYYRDSFDADALATELLAPFAAGAERVPTGRFDHRTDTARHAAATRVPPTAVLLVDGVFLLRPGLRRHWDVAVHLHVPEAVTLARAARRDVPALGTPEEVDARYRTRYLPGQALYRAEAHPHDEADVVVDNTDPSAPRLVRWRRAAR